MVDALKGLSVMVNQHNSTILDHNALHASHNCSGHIKLKKVAASWSLSDNSAA